MLSQTEFFFDTMSVAYAAGVILFLLKHYPSVLLFFSLKDEDMVAQGSRRTALGLSVASENQNRGSLIVGHHFYVLPCGFVLVALCSEE